MEDLEQLSDNGCTLTLPEKIMQKSGKKLFRLNARTGQRIAETVQNNIYPECPEQKEWNTEGIRKNFQNWRASIFNQEDLNWFHDSSTDPLDLAKPKIEITFDQFVGRKKYEKYPVSLFKHCL